MGVLSHAHTWGESSSLKLDNFQDPHGKEQFAHGHNQGLFFSLEQDKVYMAESTGIGKGDHLGTFLSMDSCRKHH